MRQNIWRGSVAGFRFSPTGDFYPIGELRQLAAFTVLTIGTNVPPRIGKDCVERVNAP